MIVQLAKGHAYWPSQVEELKPLLNRTDVTWAEVCGPAVNNYKYPPIVPYYDPETDTVIIESPLAFG